MGKVFKSHKQQLKILRSRGMDIPVGWQGSKVIRILEKENYYNVVNGYKGHFIQQGELEDYYINNPKFTELYTVFCFDRNVRLIYLKYLLQTEHYIKTVISYEFSKIYGHDNYLKIDNFDLSNQNSVKRVMATIGHIQSSISSKMGKNKEVTHYMSTYGYVPLWVLVNILTLGEISRFYENMKQNDKNRVSRKFKLQPDELGKYIKNITLARNLCAHDERFYDFIYKNSISARFIPNLSMFDIPVQDGNFKYGTNDAFSIAVIFSLILQKSDIKSFISSIDNEFSKLKRSLSRNIVDDILLKMGFGCNWKKLLYLCK